MAVIRGYVGRIGAVGTAEPVGRVELMDPAEPNTSLGVIQCASGPRLDMARDARALGQLCQIDTGTSTSPMVATSVQLV
jgi:hypothetical protein